MALSVSEIIWCWWRISKWQWCIGRLILATDSWSTETDLSHCYTTTMNTRLTREWTQASALMGCCLTACFSFLFCVLINLLALVKNHKSFLWTHKLITKEIQQLAYLWHNCLQAILWECISTVMHYTTIVIRHSVTGDCACVIFHEIVFSPWWRTDKLHCIFTVFTEPHNNTIFVPLWLLKVCLAV